MAEDLLLLSVGQCRNYRLEQLTHHVEGLVALLLAATGEEHRADLPLRQPAHLGEHGGLAKARRSDIEQQFPDLRTLGPDRPTEGLEGFRRRTDLRPTFVQVKRKRHAVRIGP
ncbi:hypothetical protein KCMC57_up30350 [Kitasatospora sp. CMC57]|uniref:Transposase n=1 Tax=Kitasatospora sp. CMC57 TaxID=3231513 RepID=A0AB33K5C1_9ACTN